jgi:hypothetical protein
MFEVPNFEVTGMAQGFFPWHSNLKICACSNAKNDHTSDCFLGVLSGVMICFKMIEVHCI